MQEEKEKATSKQILGLEPEKADNTISIHGE